MTDKRKTCGYCGQKIPNEVKVNGYSWEQKEGYNFGHWVKDKKKRVTKDKLELNDIYLPDNPSPMGRDYKKIHDLTLETLKGNTKYAKEC